MSFLYFAYGSNLWLPQIRSRCPSARPVGLGSLEGWKLVFDKPSTDGSAKANIRKHPGGSVHGVLYDIADAERTLLDEAEPLYSPIEVDVDGRTALTYTYEGSPHEAGPYDWYVSVCALGASSHGLPPRDGTIDAVADPLLEGIRPATVDDLPLVQNILSDGLEADTDRYYIHPGDYAWWVYHDDPRFPDHFSTWIHGSDAFVVIDSLDPTEIDVFARPGIDRRPLIGWAQRRLGGRGQVGWILEGDELGRALEDDGYEVASSDRIYSWDLGMPVPTPELPDGWELRSLGGEDEANTRRQASHAAFQSTMPDAMHLQRYLGFMRSAAYVPERDLVAVTPEGRVASFMVWWADDSGIAQIEPFGTHPDFHRQGIGRALVYYGLGQMREAGMTRCRVVTNDWREATSFYEGVGFEDAGRVLWWKKPL